MSKENPITSFFGKGYNGSIFQKAREEMNNALDAAEILEEENTELKRQCDMLRIQMRQEHDMAVKERNQLLVEIEKLEKKCDIVSKQKENLQKELNRYKETDSAGRYSIRSYRMGKDGQWIELPTSQKTNISLLEQPQTTHRKAVPAATSKPDTPKKDEIDEVVDWKNIVEYAKEQQKPEVVESIVDMLKSLCFEKERTPKELKKNIKELTAHANQLRKPQPMIQNNHGSMVFTGSVSGSNFNPPSPKDKEKETE